MYGAMWFLILYTQNNKNITVVDDLVGWIMSVKEKMKLLQAHYCEMDKKETEEDLDFWWTLNWSTYLYWMIWRRLRLILGKMMRRGIYNWKITYCCHYTSTILVDVKWYCSKDAYLTWNFSSLRFNLEAILISPKCRTQEQESTLRNMSTHWIIPRLRVKRYDMTWKIRNFLVRVPCQSFKPRSFTKRGQK